MIKNTFYTLIVLLFSTAAAIYLFRPELLADYIDVEAQHSQNQADHAGHGGHEGHEEAEVPKGPHRGRLLKQGDFSLEVTIFETGVEPEFHLYAYEHGKPLAPGEVSVQIELERLDGQVDRFSFEPQRDYLLGDGVVTEPHSFVVSVTAEFAGQRYDWHYDNYEGRVQIDPHVAEQTGIKTEPAGPQTIHQTVEFKGRVQADPNRLSHVRARFPGMVKTVRKQLGEQVRKGEVLVVIQSDESLQNYEVRAPIGGVIIKRDVQVGEATADESLFTIYDLSQVWVELDVFERDLNRVQVGQAVYLETLGGDSLEATINWLSPIAAHASQSIQARVVVDNPDNRLRPGQFIRARVTIAEHAVPLAVRPSGIQDFRDFKVVFAQFHDRYEVRMLELGRRDQDWVEVLGGLKPDTEYVTENSYLIKADIEKSGASHDH